VVIRPTCCRRLSTFCCEYSRKRTYVHFLLTRLILYAVSSPNGLSSFSQLSLLSSRHVAQAVSPPLVSLQPRVLQKPTPMPSGLGRAQFVFFFMGFVLVLFARRVLGFGLIPRRFLLTLHPRVLTPFYLLPHSLVLPLGFFRLPRSPHASSRTSITLGSFNPLRSLGCRLPPLYLFSNSFSSILSSRLFYFFRLG